MTGAAGRFTGADNCCGTEAGAATTGFAVKGGPAADGKYCIKRST